MSNIISRKMALSNQNQL